MTTHSSSLAWRNPWTEKSARLQSIGLQSQTQLSDFHFFLHQALGRLSKSKQYRRLVEDNGYILCGENFLKATFESEI